MTTSPVMRWLAEGVPITLLCDLAATGDPQSQTISLSERPGASALNPCGDLDVAAHVDAGWRLAARLTAPTAG